ncbi:MAG: single-stranded-DNA-specific exonuclease RecJ [Oscillospiraceae bacterium]|nr:single-stranded-DNA-specific exonuclease RecJ [Oscillospiraceae bacterium]
MQTNPVWDVRLRQPEDAARLTEAGIPYLNALALAARGVTAPEEAPAFMDGGGTLHDPLLLPDMDKAAARIRAAVQNGETIAVYGDYDVDGVTSTVLLYEQLTAMGARVIRYIPDRLSDGHGLREDRLAWLKAGGASLAVTVDTGISAVREARYAAELGLDLIITDHHECTGGVLPDALAVVDPKRPDSAYPFAGLAGVGVAFKLACALEGNEAEALRRYGDLVALGTVADVAPLTDENRALVRAGLERLADSPRPGLRALMRETGCEGRVTARAVAFKLAPRLNAAGRMDRADAAVELLLCAGAEEAERLAVLLGELNLTRKSIAGDVLRQALSRLRELGPEAVRYAAVLEGEGWHEGVTGIVAGQLVEQTGVPVFLISLTDGPYAKGSARAVPPERRTGGGVNLAEALAACGELLDTHGGHDLAAGFRVRRENIPALRQALTAFCREAAETEAGPAPACVADAVADPERVTLETVRALERMEPFGAGNPEPLFVFEDVLIRGVEPLKNGAHTRLTLDAGGQVFSAVWFGMRPERMGVGRDELADAAFTPGINCFRGRESVQLQMRAIRPSREQTRIDAGQWDAYNRFCGGGADLTAGQAALLRPSRHHMGLVWRSLAALESLEAEPAALARALGGGHLRRLPVGMVWVTLDVFAEYDLIDLKKGPLWYAGAGKQAVKTDIEGSRILAALDRLI